MESPLRYHDFTVACNALEVFANDTNARNQAMARFRDQPPPYYGSAPSSDATQIDGIVGPYRWGTASPIILDDSWYVGASRPDQLFTAQVRQESIEVETDAFENPQSYVNRGCYDAIARDNIIAQWKEQNIWDDDWDTYDRMRPWADSKWRHEEEFDPNSTPRPVSPGHYFSNEPTPTRPKLTPQEISQLEAQRDASRPFNQFMYQVTRRSRQLQTASGGFDTSSLDVNTQAYHMVRETWIKWRIWDEAWGVLPGRSWPHEERRCQLPPSPGHVVAVPSDADAAHDVDVGSSHSTFRQGAGSEEVSEVQPCLHVEAVPQTPNIGPMGARMENEEVSRVTTSSPEVQRRRLRAAPTAKRKQSKLGIKATAKRTSSSASAASGIRSTKVRQKSVNSQLRRSKRLQNKNKHANSAFISAAVGNTARPTTRQHALVSKRGTRRTSKRSG